MPEHTAARPVTQSPAIGMLSAFVSTAAVLSRSLGRSRHMGAVSTATATVQDLRPAKDGARLRNEQMGSHGLSYSWYFVFFDSANFSSVYGGLNDD